MREQHILFRRALVGFLCLVMSVAVSAVQPGDDEDAVRAELGPPVGRYQLGNRTILSFERGDVEFIDGKVTRSELISAEAAVERTARREREAAEAAERARIAKEKRIAEGQEIHQRKISDPAFMNASAAERVTFWNGFKKKYPEVPLGPEYDQAVSEYNLEQQAQRAAARSQTQVAASQTYSEPTRTYYNDSYYRNGGPIIVGPGHNRPGHNHGPTVTKIDSSSGYGFQRFDGASTSPRRSARPPSRPRPTPLPSGRR